MIHNVYKIYFIKNIKMYKYSIVRLFLRMLFVEKMCKYDNVVNVE